MHPEALSPMKCEAAWCAQFIHTEKRKLSDCLRSAADRSEQTPDCRTAHTATSIAGKISMCSREQFRSERIR